MVFSSPFFLFVFLPIVLLLIGFGKKEFHNTILLVASLFFYAWGSVSQTYIFIASITINYFFGLLISNHSENKKAKLFLIIAVIINLALLGYYKYFNFLIENINGLITSSNGELIKHESVTLPIGISFFTFHALSYVIDVYRKKVPVQRNYLDLALYISFFPQLIAGPIVRYIDVATQFKSRTISTEKVALGIQRFIFGLAKKLIVANTMAYIADKIVALPTEQISAGVAWLGALAYTFQIYFDFSGYSDMAIGLAKIFGFDFPENFNYPYIASSIKEFWRRWHISLSTWFKDFLYIPLGGNRGSETKTTVNLLIVFFCTGFWHGASWTFVVWGMFHGLFLLIERRGLDKILLKTWRPIQICYTFLVVMIGWVFFRQDTLSGAIDFIGKMSFTSSNKDVQYFLIEFVNNKIIFLFVFAIMYSFRMFRWFISFLEKFFAQKNLEVPYQLLFVSSKFVIGLLLFFISISYLAGSSYNPFIYFRF